jgi:hypothetical protein
VRQEPGKPAEVAVGDLPAADPSGLGRGRKHLKTLSK